MLKDHLANIRAVITDEVKIDQYPAATLEDANTATETKLYQNADVALPLLVLRVAL